MQELTKAMVKFHMEVGKIKKDSKNPFFNSTYASLSNILDVVTPVLVQCDLNVFQMPVEDGKLRTVLSHISGEFIESSFDMQITKRDPQAMGSAITYARRYALGAMLNLNIDEDDDANSAKPSESQANTYRNDTSKQSASRPKASNDSDDKPWLNAVDKDGNMTDLGKQVAMAIIDGKRTWEQIREKNKVSKKDFAAVNDYIEYLQNPQPPPNASDDFPDDDPLLPF